MPLKGFGDGLVEWLNTPGGDRVQAARDASPKLGHFLLGAIVGGVHIRERVGDEPIG